MEHFTAMIWQTNSFLPIQPEKVLLADRFVIAAMVKKQVISGVFTMKKIISYFLSGIVLCTALLVTPVSAAEVAPAEETITINSTVSVRATNYWTKTTTKLNSVYGTASNISTVSSGSVSGSNPQILKIEVYSRVSSGSDSFYLYVEDGNGNVNYTTVSKSGTITINDFNGFDPSGKWKIWIVTKGTVSTSTETIKVYYTY